MTFWEAIAALFWPGTIGFVVWLFRNEIRKTFDRLQQVEIGGKAGTKFKLGLPEFQTNGPPGWTPTERRLGRKIEPKLNANWKNTANIFWLAKDLSDAYTWMQLGMEKRMLLLALNQCRHHVRCLNFSDKRYEERLTALIKDIEHTPEAKLDKETRLKFAKDVVLLRDEIAVHIEANQPDFQPWPT